MRTREHPDRESWHRFWLEWLLFPIECRDGSAARAATCQYEHLGASKGTMYPESARPADSRCHLRLQSCGRKQYRAGATKNAVPIRPWALPGRPTSAIQRPFDTLPAMMWGSGVVPALVGLGGTGERLIAGISWRLSGRRRTGCGGFASPGSAGSPARFALRAGICVLFYLLLTQG